MSRLGTLGGRLYRGDVSYDFVGRQKRWYAISGLILLVCILGLLFRGLNLGIEFKGGAVFTVKTQTGTVEQARTAVANAGVSTEPIVTDVKSSVGRSIRIQTEPLSGVQSARVTDEIAKEFGVQPGDINVSIVGATWGQQITKKALTGLIVFLIAVVLYLTVTFEWRMAIAAIVALIHDVVITIGVYALTQIEVTPATVIGLLTILGYSLYDTVVVFDKVKENTRGLAGGSRMTYSQAANLAVNQTLVRSINTSVIALLPVAALLFGGSFLLGAGTLKDLALALFVGIAAGTYSSIFIATPLLADLKEREPAMQALAKRVAARGGAPGTPARTSATASAKSGGSNKAAATTAVLEADEDRDDESLAAASEARSAGVKPAGPRQQPRRSSSSQRRSGKGKRR